VDVERTIEFILEQQARHQVRHDLEMAEIRAIMRETQEMARETQEMTRDAHELSREALANGRRTDARLDRAVRLAVAEARRERKRRQVLEANLSKLEASVQRYIDSRGNGQNRQN